MSAAIRHVSSLPTRNAKFLFQTLRKASPDADADAKDILSLPQVINRENYFSVSVVAESNSNPVDADAAPEDPVRAEQGRPEVVAESNSNPVDADAAPEDPVRAKQSRLEELKRNVAGSDCKSFR
ncbi:hypothetical protein EAI_12336 [Harpegnathos saltator]|uniref:Uncharacterized protein n=1 Tax=Harpegnathos saltator TaxID=610380 RepID=E2BR40_HARSA|nr:hypothetical protein EAI_12336 [Harpegnathos saltator]